jgi:hypothetical protein
MAMKNGDKVVQMIPAAGYYAAYQDGPHRVQPVGLRPAG